jgi:RNA polymerase sigma-70 factor (ECF subfamily)
MPILTCHNESCKKDFKSRKSEKKFCSNPCYLEHRKNNPEEYNKGTFKKGQNPWNKGKKLTKIGDTMIRTKTLKDGNKKRLRFVNVGDSSGGIRYIRNDRYVWENFYGPVPVGHVIYHKDGRTLNDDIRNLECVPIGEALSRYASLRENTYDLTNKKDVQKIIKGCEVNDRRIQKMLFEMTYEKNMHIAMRYAKDKDSAQDILSDAFIKVFDKMSTFTLGRSFEGWISRVVVNTAIDSIRKSKNTYVMDSNDMSYFDGMASDDEEFEFQDAKEIAGIPTTEILAEVQNLSPMYKLVFNMYVFEEMTHKEIAEELGISDGTSKSNLSKARQNLKNAVAKLIREKNEKEKRIKRAHSAFDANRI